MSKQKDHKPGYGKILDAWVPSEDAGEPVGCVTTSFTFDPVLFEEECLGRFLQLETDATQDGPAYLVEREEKLSQLQCAAALVDQHQACGGRSQVRSLRWDLLPARPPRGILHAKVSLLLWSSLGRLIVASANLTEYGYRRNHEVFAVLDYFEGGESPLAVLREVIDFLREAASYADATPATSNPATSRWNAFLDRVSRDTRGWGLTAAPRLLTKPRVFAVLTGPGRTSAMRALREQWPDGSPPDLAFVLSPFFDPPEAPNAPARELWTLLKQRGEATAVFDLVAEELPGEKALLLHAPESLLHAQPENRSQTKTLLQRLQLEDGRPLHAKSLWLQNERAVLLMIGSSNFTSAGLGIGDTQNLEANLAYVVSIQNRDAVNTLMAAWLPTEQIPDDIERRWEPRRDEEEDSAIIELAVLPSAFGQANFGCDEHHCGFVEFTFSGEPPPNWSLFAEDEQGPFLAEADWRAQGVPASIRVPWPPERAPSGFRVRWAESPGYAWWPVNVVTSAALPPLAELRDMPLEVLIEILTSAKPLHQTLRRWLRRQEERKSAIDAPVLDPHKRVDTSAFLLQRTRRVSDALRALRERLERPVVSEQSLSWRLRGPVGVMALAQAIAKETKDRSEGERCFLITELCLELARVVPATAPGCLSANRVRAVLREIACELRATLSLDALASMPALAAYAEAAFKEIGL